MTVRRRRPDYEVRRLLRQLALVRPPTASESVASVRRNWQLAVKAFGSREPVESVTEREISGPHGPIRLRVYTPRGAAEPAPGLLWIHGGGFVAGDLYTAGAMCRSLAHRSGAVVVAVGYRLAPEHPLAVGREDCLTALRWVAEHATKVGIDPSQLAVGGDSAGGGIAAVVAQECARSGPVLSAQVLVYPATDLTASHASASESMPGLLDGAWMSWFRSRISEVSDLSDPEASAIQAADLTGVAPAIVVTAGFDPLRDEGLGYAERLQAHGVPVRLLHYPGQIHGFLSLDRVLAGGRDGLRRLGMELSRAFAGNLEPGVDADLPSGADMDPLLWLHPQQRWHELKVSAIVMRERLRSRTGPREPGVVGRRR